jgi:HEAT repeat protein
MDLKIINDMPPWEWPAETAEMLLNVLCDPAADFSDRLLAVEMAGDMVVVNNELAETLLGVVENNDETEELRARAVISLGPALEHADIYEFDDPDDIVLSEEVFQRIQASLQKIYHDAGIPKNVRRRVLEAAVRAPLDWHSGAVQAAFAGEDEDWRLTAVFCMRFIKGFDRQILEALESGAPEIHYQAVYAAGNWGIKAAWPQIAAQLSLKNADRPLLLAAIEAAAGIGLHEAAEPLTKLLDSDDDDIIDSVHEALAMLGVGLFDDEYKEDDW